MSTTAASAFAAYAASRSSVFTKLDHETRAKLNEAIIDRTYGSHRATYDKLNLHDKLSFTAFYLYARNIRLISADSELSALHHHVGRPEQSAAQFLLARLAEAAIEPDTSSKVIQRLAEAWSCAERISLNQRRFLFQKEQAAQKARDREADRAERAEARAQRARQREADRAERARQREADRAERAQARAQARAERIEARIQARAERLQSRAQRAAQRAEDRADRARRAAESRAFCECPLDYTAPTPEERSANSLDAYDLDPHNMDAHNVDTYDVAAHNVDAHDDAACAGVSIDPGGAQSHASSEVQSHGDVHPRPAVEYAGASNAASEAPGSHAEDDRPGGIDVHEFIESDGESDASGEAQSLPLSEAFSPGETTGPMPIQNPKPKIQNPQPVPGPRCPHCRRHRRKYLSQSTFYRNEPYPPDARWGRKLDGTPYTHAEFNSALRRATRGAFGIDRDPELYAGPKPYEKWELDAEGRPLSPEAVAEYLKEHPDIMKGVPHHTTYMFDNIPPDSVPLIEGMEFRRQQFKERQKAAGTLDTADTAADLRAREARAEQQLKEILAGADIPDDKAESQQLETGNTKLETHSPHETGNPKPETHSPRQTHSPADPPPRPRYEPFLPKPSNPWYDAW